MSAPKAARRIRLFRATLAIICLIGFRESAPAASVADIRQRVGIYIWGRVPDLTVAVADAQRLGATNAVRAFIGPWSDTPPYSTDLRTLREKLMLPGYEELFSKYKVIMLTAYDSASYAKEYGSVYHEKGSDRHHPAAPSLKVVQHLHSMGEQQAQQFLAGVKREYRDFAFELSKLDRTFIISNWEAENDVPDASLWPSFSQYLQARLDGIIEGRELARRQAFPARVFTAFEFTIVPGFKGQPSGLVDIASKLRGVDYLSYSSWRSIGAEFSSEEMHKSFTYGLRLIRGFAIQAGLPQRLIIGEFGEYWNEHPNGERLKAIIDASLENQVEYLFSWVLYEQPGDKDERGRDASHFGKYGLKHSLTPQGKAFQRWFLAPAGR
jgi:hypothetical protein